MVILMIAGDFLAMSLTTDNVRPSPLPNTWRIGHLTIAGAVMGICFLAFSVSILAIGKYGMELGSEALRTLAFITLAFGSQATLYAIRERGHLWSSKPGLWVVVSSAADLIIASALATLGILMMPLSIEIVGGTLAAAIAFAFVLDTVKISVFSRLRIA